MKLTCNDNTRIKVRDQNVVTVFGNSTVLLPSQTKYMLEDDVNASY